MPYCTQQDILNSGISQRELAELTSDQGGVIDALTVAAAIKKADDEIDGYVGVKYSIPLATTPGRVNTWSVKITKFYLFEGRSHRLGGIPEAIRDGYKDSVAQLKDVSRGSLSLGVDPPPAKSSTSGGSFKGDDRDFTRDSMKGL